MAPPARADPEIGNRQRGLVNVRRAPRFGDHFHRAGSTGDWSASTLPVFFSGELTFAGANINWPCSVTIRSWIPSSGATRPGLVRREHLLHQRQQRRQHVVGLKAALGDAGFEELEERRLRQLAHPATSALASISAACSLSCARRGPSA